MNTKDQDHDLLSEETLCDAAETYDDPDTETIETDLASGARINRFLVIEQLGKGGMGVVYKAYDPELDRRIAIKLITVAPRKDETASVPHARLLREAQALAKLNHPNVVSVFDVGTYEKKVYIAMEFVEGKTVREWIEQTIPSRREILDVFIAAGKGLHSAHEAGLIHRDFKPDNVMVGNKGQVRILDFGLARASGMEGESKALVPDPQFDISSSDHLLTTPLTQAGSYLGTIVYMAPEQFEFREVTEKTDQFSFCVSLFEALCGQRPFAGKSVSLLRENVTKGKIEKPANDVPDWIFQILRRGLETDPNQRYDSLEDLLLDLQFDPEEEKRKKQEVRKRRIIIATSILFSILIAAGGIWYGFNKKSQLCKGAEAKMVGVWDEQVQQTVERSLLGTGLSYAAQVSEKVSQSLNNYKAKWIDMHNQACSATRIEGHQSEELLDLRMLCLLRRKKEVKALTSVLSQANAKTAEQALQAVSGLSMISDCQDIEALSSGIKPPKDKQVYHEVEQVRTILDKVKALSLTGQYKQARDLALQTVPQARQTEYKPVLAETLLWLGEVQRSNGEYDKSEKTLFESYFTALSIGHDVIAARAANNLMFVIGYYLDRPKEAHRIAKSANALIERSGENPRIRSNWHAKLASVFESENKIEQSMEHDRKAYELNVKLYGEIHFQVALSLNNLGLGYSFKGDYDRAIEYYQKSLEVIEKTLGPQHPQVGMNLNNIGNTYYNKGDIDKAIETHQKALAHWTRALGPEHPDLGSTLNSLGTMYTQKGEYDKAEQYLLRAIRIWEKALGKEHPDLGMALNNLGDLYRQKGEYQKALTQISRALRVREKALGKDHPRLVYSLDGLSNVYENMKDYRHAKINLERALAICLKRTCLPHQISSIRFSLARNLIQINSAANRSRALELAQQAAQGFASLPYAKEELKLVKKWIGKMKAKKD